MAEQKEFIVAFELGSSKVTGIVGQKKPDGSISVLALAKEESSSFIRKGVVYNIDKTAQCLASIKKKLESQLHTQITQAFVGVGGQSVRGVRNVVPKDLPADTIITQEMVVELMDSNRNLDYPDQKIIDLAEQEYRVDSQLQLDPVGIRASRLESNYLIILERNAFFQNLNKCFEQAGIPVVELYLGPQELANAVLTEAEKRSGCALVDLGADTTTVAVYYKNVLRHLAVIPLGSNNITKDIASLQMEESEAEKMKLKYASAYTDNNDIDDTLKYSIDQDRQVESRKFIEIVEGRLEEIILNVREQIPNEYYDKLLGGIILTGGGSNLKNIEKAFSIFTRIEKIRTAKFVTMSINSSNEAIKAHDGRMNTVLGLLVKGNVNCAGRPIDPNQDLFDNDNGGQPEQPDRKVRQRNEVGPGIIRSAQEEELAKAAAQRKREEEAAAAAAAEQKKREEEAAKAAREAEIRRQNKWYNKLKNKLAKFTDDMTSPE
jgi:cell division protein FtsA